MITSPYKLNLNPSIPNQFYDDLANFTPKIVRKGEKELRQHLFDFKTFNDSNSNQKQTDDEYFIEMLMIGIFWNNYHQKLSIDALFYLPLFNQLYALRKNFKRLKNRVDRYRGELSYKLLASNRNKKLEIHQRFEYLLSWMDCTKEFKQELERLNHWKLFLENSHVDYQVIFWKDIENFALWFTKEAESHLGKYTKSWTDFMMDNAKEYKNKEDYFFCTRKPNEYHLNMVAAEVMNTVLKPAYEKTKNKIVLLPTCMVKSENCQAKLDSQQLKCTHCNLDCNVSQLTQQLNKKGVETVLIPHSSGFSKQLKPWKNSKDTALIGVACTLNLISGGYEMQKLNIPSQCVFLDSCGCKKHWLSGQTTYLNSTHLNNLLINEHVKQPINSTC